MSNQKDPFAGFRPEEKVGDAAFAKLEELLKLFLDAEVAVAEAEAKLKEAQETKRRLEEFEIPDYMDSLGMKKFTNKAGLEVEVGGKIRASIGDRKVQAFKWLIDNGHSGIVKRSVQVAFNVKDGEAAEELLAELRERKVGAGVRQDMKVEAATLTAFIRKRLEKGEEVPHDIFGIYEQRFVKINSPQE